MKSIELQPATTTQAEQIADLSRKTFYETFAASNTVEDMELFMTKQFSREKLIAEVADPSCYFFTALIDGKLAGYLKLQEGEEHPQLGGKPAIEIARIYADTSFIGAGVGKALMQCALEQAALRKKEVIWLGVWEHNQRAISFYTKWGFEKFGVHDFLLGNDRQTDWLMFRAVTDPEKQ